MKCPDIKEMKKVLNIHGLSGKISQQKCFKNKGTTFT